MSNDALIRTPDLTRYGLYLYPKLYRNTMGYTKAQGLLLLDSTGCIQESIAHEANLIKLLNSASAVLYAVSPVDGHYPNAGELLQNLKLGKVASQRRISKTDLHQEFVDACQHSSIMLNILDKTDKIGVNYDNETVYETKSGRYLVDDNGNRFRNVEPERLLYAMDQDGNLVPEKVEYCLKSLLKINLDVQEDNIDFVNENDFTAFVQTISEHPPPFIPEINGYEQITYYEKPIVKRITTKTDQVVRILEKLECKLMLDIDVDNFDEFKHLYTHTYNRHLPASNHKFKPCLPLPLIIILSRLMRFTLVDEPVIYCPYIGNIAMLCGLVVLNKYGNKVIGCEKHQDKQMEFNDFLKNQNIDDIEVNEDSNIEDFDGSITYISSSDSALSRVIPNSSFTTFKNNISQIIELLDRRKAKGRSIFITATDERGSLGYADIDSLILIKHLYSNYNNVVVFDCNAYITKPSRYNCEYRIYIVGEKKEDATDEIFINEEDDFEDISISIIDDANTFFAVCSAYQKEIADVEISSVDIMESFLPIIEEEFFNDDDSRASGDDNEDKPDSNVDKDKSDVDSETDVAAAEKSANNSDADPDDSVNSVIDDNNDVVEENTDIATENSEESINDNDEDKNEDEDEDEDEDGDSKAEDIEKFKDNKADDDEDGSRKSDTELSLIEEAKNADSGTPDKEIEDDIDESFDEDDDIDYPDEGVFDGVVIDIDDADDDDIISAVSQDGDYFDDPDKVQTKNDTNDVKNTPLSPARP